jgi:hypothetical protein
VSYLSITDADRVFRFLASTGRLELPRASWIEQSGYLEHRAEMAIRGIIREVEPKRELTDASLVWFQTWIQTHADIINREGSFPFLNAAKREIAQYGQIRLEEVPPPLRFLVVRAKPDHPDAWLTNRLISDFVRFDFVSRYIFNKQGFYKDYDSYTPQWRENVVVTLKNTYLKDKAAFREHLYGLID